MKIGIDASRVTKPQLTGTEYYSIELIRAIAQIDQEDDFILYAPKNPMPRLGELGDNFRAKVIPFPKLWTHIRLSFEMLRSKPDVLFVPAHLIPLIHPANSVVTLHDLGFRHYPELYPASAILYHNLGMSFSARHAKKIITDSEYTKRDLLKTYVLEPDKIEVIYLGCNLERFKPNEEIAKKPIIFYIGRLEEKKNVAAMIRAYAILRKEETIKHKFVLAGSPGFGYEKIQEEIQKLPENIRKDVIELGYINDDEYLRYLQEADIFFFCSLFEGFGLPIIEAMACGTPVVTSNVACMPEIAGNAAMLCDPKNELEMAAALSKLIHQDRLKQAQILKGRVRAKFFTWQKTAQKTLDVIRKAQ